MRAGKFARVGAFSDVWGVASPLRWPPRCGIGGRCGGSGRGQVELGRTIRRTIRKVKEIGRRRWKKESGYHRQARAENAFFRYKSIIGDRLRARNSNAQKTEALIACNILNRMTNLGRPKSYAIES